MNWEQVVEWAQYFEQMAEIFVPIIIGLAVAPSFLLALFVPTHVSVANCP